MYKKWKDKIYKYNLHDIFNCDHIKHILLVKNINDERNYVNNSISQHHIHFYKARGYINIIRLLENEPRVDSSKSNFEWFCIFVLQHYKNKEKIHIRNNNRTTMLKFVYMLRRNKDKIYIERYY